MSNYFAHHEITGSVLLIIFKIDKAQMKMKQVMSHNINNGLLNIIRRTDPMIIIVSFLYLFMQRTYADSYGLSVKIRCRPLLIIVTGGNHGMQLLPSAEQLGNRQVAITFHKYLGRKHTVSETFRKFAAKKQ